MALGNPRAPARVKADIALPTDQFTRAVGDLKAVSRIRLYADLDHRFRDYLSHAKAVAAKRNRIAHGTWTASADEQGRYRCEGLRQSSFQKDLEHDLWSVSDVHVIAQDIHDVRHELHGLLPELVTALPELRAHTTEGPVPASLLRHRPGIA